MKIKNILIGLGTITAVIAPISSTIACGTSKTEDAFVSKAEMAILQKQEFTHRNDKFDLTKFESTNFLKDAVIERWIDGDTPIVTLDGKKGIHIRITSIDTPELHTDVDTGKMRVTTGSEYDWAMKAKEFGEKVMPVGTHIKVFTDGGKSYDRIVGSLFYKENNTDKEYTSFAVEMLRRGLATSFVSDASSASNENSILGFTGHALADAYNYALKTSAGLFGTDIINILRIHGITSDLPIRWTGVKYDHNSFGVKNIYDVLHLV